MRSLIERMPCGISVWDEDYYWFCLASYHMYSYRDLVLFEDKDIGVYLRLR